MLTNMVTLTMRMDATTPELRRKRITHMTMIRGVLIIKTQISPGRITFTMTKWTTALGHLTLMITPFLGRLMLLITLQTTAIGHLTEMITHRIGHLTAMITHGNGHLMAMITHGIGHLMLLITLQTTTIGHLTEMITHGTSATMTLGDHTVITTTINTKHMMSMVLMTHGKISWMERWESKYQKTINTALTHTLLMTTHILPTINTS
jgi:hypothetical protein